MKDLILVEKYRPKEMNDVILNEKDKIKSFISNPSTLPHLLFFGKAGIGKTTVARIIVNKLNADCLFLNASDDNSVGNIRDKVKAFVSTMRRNRYSPKIVLLDEADYLTNSAQAVLRGLMEQFHGNARFILTCNYSDKIIEPIQSRCVRIDFSMSEKVEILERLKFICKEEDIKYDEDALKKIIDICYPDIRKCINKLQELTMDSRELKLEYVKKEDEIFEEIFSLIKTGQAKEGRKIWIKNNLDLRELLRYVYKNVLDNVKCLMIIAEISYRMGISVDQEITFFAGMSEVGDILVS